MPLGTLLYGGGILTGLGITMLSPVFKGLCIGLAIALLAFAIIIDFMNMKGGDENSNSTGEARRY